MYLGKPTFGEKVFNVINYTLLAFLTITFIVPFLNVIATSFISEKELIERGFVLIPRDFDLTSYKLFLRKGSVLVDAYKVTVLRVVLGSVINLFVTAMFAYPMAKKDLPGRNFFITMVFITMLIGGGLIPTYMVVKSLNLINSFWALIIPSMMSVWNMLILRNFFYTIPPSLEESAFIDGATPFIVLTRIILPLSLPSLATIGLFYAVGHWNAWFDAVIYINEPEKYPVQVILRNFVLNMTAYELELEESTGLGAKPPSVTIRSTVIVISTLPILFIYPFVQKYFVKGIMVGSVKG
ncbi:MAG: carbohydrate ABC transporter permease [Caldicoprobacterales bacterium]|jgi:putative aldouronate transport system permease protein|nr:carbohydrate ABC transporter permease [Clostridiales bacterium]